jgi:hypothetical protein
MAPTKFCHLVKGEPVPHDYGNLYFRQPSGASERLVIDPSVGQVDILIELAAELKGHPWFVLYLLLVPRQGNRPAGRYQSQPFESHKELKAFLLAFRDFFEGDGRHHVWVGSASNDGLLVYDQHNVIFAYGPLLRFEELLSARGFGRKEFWFPSPHAHSYQPNYDSEEERLMKELNCKHSPLKPGDEWD